MAMGRSILQPSGLPGSVTRRENFNRAGKFRFKERFQLNGSRWNSERLPIAPTAPTKKKQPTVPWRGLAPQHAAVLRRLRHPGRLDPVQSFLSNGGFGTVVPISGSAGGRAGRAIGAL